MTSTERQGWQPEGAGARSRTVLVRGHGGTSMNPALDRRDLLQVVPYVDEPIRVGDVILFLPTPAHQPVVHRVVEVTTAGIRTRGDNSRQDDPWLISPGDVVGRVTAAYRGHKGRKVAGGPVGSLCAHLGRWQQRLKRCISRLLKPLYGFLVQRGIVQQMFIRCLRPRVIRFEANGAFQLRLLLGKRLVGWYDKRRRRWHIRRRFRPFVDEMALPRIRE